MCLLVADLCRVQDTRQPECQPKLMDDLTQFRDVIRQQDVGPTLSPGSDLRMRLAWTLPWEAGLEIGLELIGGCLDLGHLVLVQLEQSSRSHSTHSVAEGPIRISDEQAHVRSGGGVFWLHGRQRRPGS
jgi:hypothetical protein